MKEMRRVLALLMCFVMLVGYIPAGALAAETEPTVAVVEQTQPAEEVVEAAFGEAVSASDEKADSTPAETEAPTEETEVVEEIIEAVFGEEISASKPAATPEETEAPEETVPAETEAEETVPAETEAEETEPAEVLEEVEASEEAEEAQAEDEDEDDLLDAALVEAQDYIAAIMKANDPSEVVGTFGKHFTWDNEKRESGKPYFYEWSYYNGVVFEGLEYLYEVTGETQYRDYVLEYMASMINEDGSWTVTSNNGDKTAAGYVNTHGVDGYKTASLLLDAYTMSGDTRYLETAAVLYADLDAAAEEYSLPNAGNNYHHTWADPSSPALWLDGLYMTLPFRAEYAALMGDQAELDLIVDRMQWVSDNMYNEKTGLFYHAADNATDNSGTHWLRSMGWYAAAMVDVMDHMEGENLEAMKAQLKKMVDGMAAVQNADNGMWLNNMKAELDAESNPYETSGTALVTYAVMKAVNNGWLDDSYAQMAIDAFLGICDEKLVDGVLKDICLKGNPGSSNSKIVDNEGKGVGPFIMLYTEIYEYLYGAVELEPVIDGIAVSGRDLYDQGDVFEDPIVTVFYTNFTNEDVTGFELVSAPDMSAAGTQTVTVSYAGRTASYEITVLEKLPVLVEGLDAEVQDLTEDQTVFEALYEQLGITKNYVAYDISADLAEGETAEVSVPVPAEWADKELTAYYIDDEGNVSDETFTVTYADGYATFTVSHFSTYVVGLAGQETKVELNGNQLSVENYTLVRYVPTEVFARVDKIDGPGDYLIAANGNTTANLLTATNNGVTNSTATALTENIKTGDGTISEITYIENPNANAIWTATNANTNNGTAGYHLNNTGTYRFLRYNNSLTTHATEATLWLSGSNTVYSSDSRRIYYNNGWQTYRGNYGTVAIYKRQTVNMETEYDRSGLYSIEGEPVTMVVQEGATADLTGTLTFAPNDSQLTPDVTDISTVAEYSTTWYVGDNEQVNGDPAGIISKVEDNTITFSGKYGSAVVEIAYAQTVNSQTYYLVNYIQITAQAPYYSIEILDASGNPSDDIRYRFPSEGSVEDQPVSFKITHTYYKDGVLVTETVTPSAGTIKWEIDDTKVAELKSDELTGSTVLRFKDEGKTTLTIYYEYEDGTSVSDTVDLIGIKRPYVIPEDETNDFPEYPNEGAVRIDKTAKAVGTFSQTGVAQVELSMSGVPFNAEGLDVVIMVDMSGSMYSNSVNRRDPAKNATIAALEALVLNEDGTFNDNRVAIYTFSSAYNTTALNPNNNGFCDLMAFDQTRLEAMTGKKTVTTNANGEKVATYSGGEINAWDAGGGTDYTVSLEQCKKVLDAARDTEEGKNRQQFVIFVTDGSPTAGFTHFINGTSGETHDTENGGYDLSDEEFETVLNSTEVFSYQMKQAGVGVYTVGIQIGESSDAGTILKKIAGTNAPKLDADGNEVEDADGNTVMEVVDARDEDYANYALFESDVNKLKDAFLKVVGQIKQAATDITVNDIVGDKYELILDEPANVDLGDTKLCIEVVEYQLDDEKNRVGTGDVIESVSLTDTSKVTLADGKVSKINANNFTYDAEKRTLIWKTPTLEKTELAIRYYVYLKNSAGVGEDVQVPAGTYKTNEKATMTYTNYLSNECQLTFPVPQMTWNGAQVTYQFYLVNEEGQPVNRAGRVIPFAEAIYVTDAVTYNVTWQDKTSVEKLEADYLAQDLLPGVYTLYDPDAYYELRVYETEGVDENGVRINYFIIEGGDVGNQNTTKVYNTKSELFDDYGAYVSTLTYEGTKITPTSSRSGVTYTDPTLAADLDYGNTVVNFAVMWTPGLTPDTVVIDYGLDVELNVSRNDIMDTEVVGVMNTQPKAGSQTVVMGSGTYSNKAGSDTTVVTIGNEEIGTAAVLSQESVSFSLNKGNGMQLNKPAVFYYETECTYWTYDTAGNGTKNTQYMYSSVTVIPATTVYYEDEYVDLKTFVNGVEKAGWDVNSVAADFVQATDRPGVYPNMDEEVEFDANNVYGYDGAYEICSTYSMDNAAMVHVNESTYATAEFDFYGTGFDVISMTSNNTGTLVVQAYPYNADGTLAAKPTKSIAVDTYYGYDYGMYYVEYVWAYQYSKDAEGNTVRTEGWRLINAYQQNFTGMETVDALPESAKIGETVLVHQMYWMQSDFNKYELYTYSSEFEIFVPSDELLMDEPATTYGEQTNPDKVVDYDGNPVTEFKDGDTFYVLVSSGLYQVPVMKIEGLTYGKYRAKIIATYSEWLDHTMEDGYDLYLDAIRIYDPAGNTYGEDGNIDKEIQDAYIADGEAWPKYFELRNLLLSAQDFDALTAGKQTEGAIFIDQKAGTYTIADYDSYGPNNELYLAPDQAVSFTLDLSAQTSVADVQIGLKSANGKYVDITMTTTGEKASETTASIGSSTDRYYSIGNHVDLDGMTTITFCNNGEEGSVASITNVKITFKEQPVETAGASETVVTNKEETNAVLMKMNAGKQEAEPEVKLDADLDVSIRKTSVKVGSSVVVKITTSADVDSLTVNGETITKFSQNRQTGKRSWTATVKAEEAGDLEIEVVAYNGTTELDTDTQTVEVTKAKATIAQNVIDTIISKLFR